MAELIPIGSLDHLFEVGVFVNAAYAVLSKNTAGAVEDLVKLERKIRSRLKKLDKVEDEDLMARRHKVRDVGRSAEETLDLLRKLSVFLVACAALTCFAFLVTAGFFPTNMPKMTLGVVLVLVFMPIPLSWLALRAATMFYAWSIEAAMMDLATKLDVHTAAKEQSAGQPRPKRLKIAMDQIEPAFGGGKSAKPAP